MTDLRTAPAATVDTPESGRGWVEALGRWGWVAKGIIYVVLGALAVGVALGSDRAPGDEEASRRGAVDRVAEQPWGWLLLAVLVVGLTLYAGWRLTTALGRGGSDGKAMVTRALWVVSALGYLLLAYLSFRALTSGAEAAGGGESSSQGLTATVLATGWGRWLVTAVGLGVLAVAAHLGKQGVEGGFWDSIDLDGMPGTFRRAITPVGAAGHLGRAGALALVGVFVVRAGWDVDASKAEGMDTALRQTASGAVGSLLVLAVGLGLILYGAFAAASAPYQELERP